MLILRARYSTVTYSVSLTMARISFSRSHLYTVLPPETRSIFFLTPRGAFRGAEGYGFIIAHLRAVVKRFCTFLRNVGDCWPIAEKGRGREAPLRFGKKAEKCEKMEIKCKI